ncbi:hypothetical protein [Nocardia brasiliensis]|uniref:hypothetical protein n=1 Tax=Nocardia brasiliensis TaxID=37326 RepID=UPI0024538F55|nr:hypothetical protein [Nocardia brasiliensis]
MLIVVPWLGSLIFTAVLAFRLGYWWKTTELQGRHAAATLALQQEWDGDTELDDDDDRADDTDTEPPDTRFESTPPPASPRRRGSDEDRAEDDELWPDMVRHSEGRRVPGAEETSAPAYRRLGWRGQWAWNEEPGWEDMDVLPRFGDT